MTQDEINALGIAFFSGKTLQYKPAGDPEWRDWGDVNCPSFLRYSWRVKPGEPKKEIWCTLRSREGLIMELVKNSETYKSYCLYRAWTHIPSLDREVILPEGVE